MLADDTESGLFLKTKHFPETFYRYRKINGYTLQSLERNELYLSPIEDLNDPFESAMSLDHNACLKVFFSSDVFATQLKRRGGISLAKGEIQTIINSNTPYETYRLLCHKKGLEIPQTSEQLYQRVMARWQEIKTEGARNVRVCCFSETNESTTMWSHYADNHKGICIAYNFSETDTIRPILQPILYTTEMPKITTLEDLTMLKIIMASVHKSPEWSYEREWRITAMPTQTGTPNQISVPTPKAIYLGDRFQNNDPDMVSKLKNILASKSIPVYKITRDDGNYRLLIKEFPSFYDS